MIYLTTYPTPVGRVTLAGDGNRLTGLWFEGQRHFTSPLPDPVAYGELPLFDDVRRWLTVYFAGHRPDFMPPVGPTGTPFRRAVWKLLGRIPYGTVVSYGQLAEALTRTTGTRVSPRAVGNAVGHNPVSLLIPCHRVVGSDGSLTGYAGGLPLKARLLALEGVTSTLPPAEAPFLFD